VKLTNYCVTSVWASRRIWWCVISVRLHPPFQWGDAQFHWGPMGHHPSRLRSEMRGSTSFSTEIGDAKSHWAWGAQAVTPWAYQMTYHAAHTPRLGRTQDDDEIWRHFCLLISAPGIEPGAPDDWYKHQPTRPKCHLISRESNPVRLTIGTSINRLGQSVI